jgi:hypothetical protein
MYTPTRHLSRSWGSFDRSTSSRPISLRFDSTLSFHLRLGLPSGLICNAIIVVIRHISLLISLICTTPKREVIHSRTAGQLADAQPSVLNDVQGTETPLLTAQSKGLTKIPARAKKLLSKNRCLKPWATSSQDTHVHPIHQRSRPDYRVYY